VKGTSSGLVGFALSRALVLLLVLVIGSYSMIVVMNMYSALDRLVEAQVRDEVMLAVALNPEFQGLPLEERQGLVEELTQLELKRRGMDRPFFPHRSLTLLRNAMSLQLGRADLMLSDTLSREVRAIVSERIWPTALLFMVSMVAVLLISFFVALAASRRPGRFLDRLVLRLAPVSALPAWLFGIFLILIFASLLRWLPWGGMAPSGMTPGSEGFVSQLLARMILPVSAIVLGSIFVAIYSWRTFFVGHSSDERAEPTGPGESTGRAVDRSSFLRPTPPRIIKHFLVLATNVLIMSIVVELVFNWPGLGQVLFQAVHLNELAVMIGVLVIYGYVLAFVAVIVFLLDFLDVWLMQRRGRVAAQGGV